MYWSCDDRLGVPGINKVMPLKKKSENCESKTMCGLCDNDNLPNPADLNRNCLFKVCKLTDMANETFLAKYKPAREISIDEAMVLFKGRRSLREYIPIKPIKCGMKVRRAAEADTGYLLQFDVYCGKRQDGTQRGLGHDVVMKLARPFLGRYHHPYFDKTNSSVALMTGRLQEKTYHHFLFQADITKQLCSWFTSWKLTAGRSKVLPESLFTTGTINHQKCWKLLLRGVFCAFVDCILSVNYTYQQKKLCFSIFFVSMCMMENTHWNLTLCLFYFVCVRTRESIYICYLSFFFYSIHNHFWAFTANLVTIHRETNSFWVVPNPTQLCSS